MKLATRQFFESGFERQPKTDQRQVAATTVDLLTERIQPDQDTVRHMVYIIHQAASPEEANKALWAQHYPVMISYGPGDIMKRQSTDGYVDDRGVVHIRPERMRSPELETLLRHEMVHVEQMGKMGRQGREASQRRFQKRVPRQGMGAYYGDPHELMAQARTAADRMLNRFSRAKVMQALRRGDVSDEIGVVYKDLGKLNPKTRNRFLKTVYAYLKSDLGESQDRSKLKKELLRTMGTPPTPEKVGEPSYYDGQKFTWNGVTGSIVRQGGMAHIFIENARNSRPLDAEAFLEGLLHDARIDWFTMTVPPEWMADPEHGLVAALARLRERGIISHQGRSGALDRYRYHPEYAHEHGRYLPDSGTGGIEEGRRQDLKNELMSAVAVDPDYMATKAQELMDVTVFPGYAVIKSLTHPYNLRNPHNFYIQMDVEPGPEFYDYAGKRGPFISRKERLQALRRNALNVFRRLYRSMNYGVGSESADANADHRGFLISHEIVPFDLDKDRVKRRDKKKREADMVARWRARREAKRQSLGENEHKKFLMSLHRFEKWVFSPEEIKAVLDGKMTPAGHQELLADLDNVPDGVIVSRRGDVSDYFGSMNRGVPEELKKEAAESGMLWGWDGTMHDIWLDVLVDNQDRFRGFRDEKEAREIVARYEAELNEDTPGNKEFWMKTPRPPDASFEGNFLPSYIQAALWSSSGGVDPDDPDGNPLYDSFENFQLTDEAKADLRRIALDFYDETRELYETDNEVSQAGHDFWFTQNHHGVGFWESEWDFPRGGHPSLGAYLTKVAHRYGEVDLDVTDEKDEYGDPYVYVAYSVH